MTERSEREEEIEERAADWVARLDGGPLSDVDRRSLELWLAEDPRHVAFFEEAREAWALMNEVAVDPGDLRRDVVALPTRRKALWRPALALAASLALVTTGLVLWFGDPRIAVAADYRTAPGERLSATLPDGSVVELGPASAIVLRFSDAERRVELLTGMAYFIAAPRRGVETRPFLVQAENGAARALGTQFSIGRQPESVEVAVVEHEVAVAVTLADGGRAEVVLSPGQAVRYADAGLTAPRTMDADQTLAWRRDRLFFDQVPLQRVVAELNRYRRGRVVIGSSALASRLVSGAFDGKDPNGALDTIARELNARIASTPLVTLLY